MGSTLVVGLTVDERFRKDGIDVVFIISLRITLAFCVICSDSK